MEEVKKEKAVKREKAVINITFVCGIVSIVFAMLWYISLPASIFGLVKSTLLIKKRESKLIKAAFILSLIGLTLCSVIYLVNIFDILAEYYY